jgi:methanogenic corrinoid protein MtbC1
MVQDIGFSVGAVARRLGVAPSTLRTWNRRYGIGAHELSPGRHRRYTAEDISRLERMQKLILRGASPADAAHAALTAGLAPSADIPAARPGPGHGSGGRRLGLPGASAAARGLARAALALDEGLITELIETALAQDRIVRTWEALLVPVLTGLGVRAEHTGTCIEAEHLLSAMIIAALSGWQPESPGQADPRPVLLACAEGDRHSLPLYALAAALAEQGISSRMFGADLPYHSLAAAVRRTGPAAVFLWSQMAASGHPAALPDLPPRRPGARLILGGPGWQRDQIPDGARLVETLPDAAAQVTAALGRS